MFIASLITATIACGVVLSLLCWLGKDGELRASYVGFACTLPMCWVMYHCVRLPLDHWLLAKLGEGDAIFWIRSAYAPLTEEPGKLWPLLIPFIRRSVTQRSIALFAVALGGGFAVGEIFTVAGIIESKMPEVAKLPWYSLGGFMIERLTTCAIHSGVTASALLVIQKGYGVIAGLTLAMGLHYIVNLPIAMSKLGWLGSNASIAQLILFAWVTICAVTGFVILFRISGAERPLGSVVYGDAICPSCGSRYSRSLLKGLNFGFSLRFEPCPECNKWHWTRRARASEAY